MSMFKDSVTTRPTGTEGVAESNKKKAFDPTVSFTFFGSWHETLIGVQQALGDSAGWALYKAIADYSLFGVEPDFKDNLVLGTIAWPLIEREIDSSIAKRQAYFAKDELPVYYEPIIKALKAYPNYSLRQIAELTGKDKNMVARVKKKYADVIAAVDDSDDDTITDDDIANAYALDNGYYRGNGIGNDNDRTGRDSAGTVPRQWDNYDNMPY